MFFSARWVRQAAAPYGRNTSSVKMALSPPDKKRWPDRWSSEVLQPGKGGGSGATERQESVWAARQHLFMVKCLSIPLEGAVVSGVLYFSGWVHPRKTAMVSFADRWLGFVETLKRSVHKSYTNFIDFAPLWESCNKTLMKWSVCRVCVEACLLQGWATASKRLPRTRNRGQGGWWTRPSTKLSEIFLSKGKK